MGLLRGHKGEVVFTESEVRLLNSLHQEGATLPANLTLRPNARLAIYGPWLATLKLALEGSDDKGAPGLRRKLGSVKLNPFAERTDGKS